jgi:type II secretory pathway component PulF
LDNALQLVERTQEAGPVRTLLASIHSSVQSGHSLSEALAEHPEAFDPLYVNLIRAGEAGGTLHQSTRGLADYLESMESLRGTITTALIYPAILLTVAIASLFLLLTFETSLEQGRGMTVSLRERNILPQMATQLIEVGEGSGQLPEMLNRVAKIYDQAVQTTLRRLLTILEPVLILGLGGLIAVIIMSVLVAILGLNDLVV